MSPAPETPPWSSSLPHVVRTQLTMIRGHAQLAARHARQLPEPDRSRLLARLQAIDAAVEQIVRRLACRSGDNRLD
jgi:hypothetical protein